MTATRAYAGIGSRKAPDHEMPLMRRLGAQLARAGWLLRSGGALRCDTAFEQGCLDAGGDAEIYLTSKDFAKRSGSQYIDAGRLPQAARAAQLAAAHHRYWNDCSDGSRALLARNTHQVLGRELDDPVRFVLCWALNEERDREGRIRDVGGGTGLAVRLAYDRGIPVFNLANKSDRERILSWLEQEPSQPTAPRSIFVFGSNERGVHGKGAALAAVKEHGAIRGQGEGLQGNAYAIPTKDAAIRPRELGKIRASVATFLDFARAHPELLFQLTPIGCGLAGFTPEQIAPMFRGAPQNVQMPEAFAAILQTIADHLEP